MWEAIHTIFWCAALMHLLSSLEVPVLRGAPSRRRLPGSPGGRAGSSFNSFDDPKGIQVSAADEGDGRRLTEEPQWRV